MPRTHRLRTGKARVLRERDDPVGWCDGFIWDVTDQALAKQEMEERERYLSMLIDNVIDAIIIIDGRGIIETFNHAAEQIFGYRSDEVIGRNLSMLMPEPDRSAHDGYLTTTRGAAPPARWSRTANSPLCGATARPSPSNCASRRSATTASAGSSAWCATSPNASASSG